MGNLISVYVDASEDCVTLKFHVGTTTTTTRSWNIMITQFKSSYENLAPSGCTQYYFNTDGTGNVRTFNFKKGTHLAQQHQNICIR